MWAERIFLSVFPLLPTLYSSLSLFPSHFSPSFTLYLCFPFLFRFHWFFFCFLAISRSSCLFRIGFGSQFSTFYVIHSRSQLSTNLFTFIICEMPCIIQKDEVVSRYPLNGLEFSFPSGERTYLLETKKRIREIERATRQGWEEWEKIEREKRRERESQRGGKRERAKERGNKERKFGSVRITSSRILF